VNENQRRVIEFMKGDPRNRDLYQASDHTKNFVTHSGGDQVKPLTNAECNELLAAGLIEPRWKDAAHTRYWCLKGYST
jgi:hypothetical protein